MAFTPITTDTTALAPVKSTGGFSAIGGPETTKPKKKGFYGKMADVEGDIGVGIVKGIGGIAKSLGKFGDFAINQTIGRISPIFKSDSFSEEGLQKAGLGNVLGEEALSSKNTAESIGKIIPNAAAFLTPGGEIAGLEKVLASKVPGAVTKFLPEMGALATKVITKAGQLGVKSAVEGLSNYGIARLTGSTAEEAKGIGKFAAIIPGIGFGLNLLRKTGSAFLGKTADTIINSLIKPLDKNFAYGKDPTRGIIREGIVANTIEDLAPKISQKIDEIGNEIGTINEFVKGKVTFDATKALGYIDGAIEQAAKLNDSTVFKRLNDVKQAITQNLVAEGGQIISQGAKDLSNISADEMFNLKKTIGNMTKFTGNPSDDKAVNSVLKRTYGKLKEMYNAGVAKVDPALGKKITGLNERFADMMSADVAVKHVDILNKRANLISLAGKIGFGTAIAGTMTYAILSGNYKKAAEILVGELAAAGLAKFGGSAFVKTRVAQLLSGMAEADRSQILNQSTTLKRIFGEFDPLGGKEAQVPNANVEGVYKAGERYPQLSAPAPGTPRSSASLPPAISVQSGEYTGPGIATPPK